MVGSSFQSVDRVHFHVYREKVQPELLFKVFPGLNRENTSVRFLMEYVFGPLGSTISFKEHESLENPFLFVMELLWGQAYIERAGIQEYVAVMTFSIEVQRAGELGVSLLHRQSEERRYWRGWYRWGGVFGTVGRGRLATNCMSCCSCAVRAARVELMLLSETCCLSVSSCRWCCRYLKASAMP